ncbi:hypothetical protein EON65_45765 [archaeon]|nr:MAG: hypothetical protein EON65_45765 [archaeon]
MGIFMHGYGYWYEHAGYGYGYGYGYVLSSIICYLTTHTNSLSTFFSRGFVDFEDACVGPAVLDVAIGVVGM